VQPDGAARRIPIAELHRLPGTTPHIDTNLQAGELITGVTLPTPIGGRQIYRKVRDRASFAFALIAVAAVVQRDGSGLVALGGVAHKPWRATKAEEVLREEPANEANFRAAADIELEDAEPLRDNAFKVPLARNIITRTLLELSEGR
jgi:xanthine dehydrogenase YagS FAD-binding subunit